MSEIDPNKTVFISYRRSVHRHLSLMLFKDLRDNGFDVFRDADTIGAGEFEKIILNQIAARMHFVVLLSYGTLDRCTESSDWLRREIEYAIETERNIVPLLIDGFKFTDAEIHLTGLLNRLKDFQAQPLYTEESELYAVGFTKLINQKLKPPIYAPPVQPTPLREKSQVEQIIQETVRATSSIPAELTAEHMLNRAWLKGMFGDTEGAINDFTEVIQLGANDAQAYKYRAALRFLRGDIEGMIADYTEAIRINPRDAECYYNRGAAYLQESRYNEALDDGNMAVDLGSADSNSFAVRGNAHFALRQYTQALSDYQQANLLKPDYKYALAGLAITYYALGKLDEARYIWSNLIEKDIRYRSVGWVRGELNWAAPLMEAVEQLIAVL